jgi:hypothetical protein
MWRLCLAGRRSKPCAPSTTSSWRAILVALSSSVASLTSTSSTRLRTSDYPDGVVGPESLPDSISQLRERLGIGLVK